MKLAAWEEIFHRHSEIASKRRKHHTEDWQHLRIEIIVGRENDVVPLVPVDVLVEKRGFSYQPEKKDENISSSEIIAFSR